MKKQKLGILLASTVALLGATSEFGHAQEAPALVIEGGTLIDGLGGEPLEDSVILIENGRFAAIGARGQVTIPTGAEIYNAAGKTILPGFIDGHCHYEHFWAELYLHLGLVGAGVGAKDVQDQLATVEDRDFHCLLDGSTLARAERVIADNRAGLDLADDLRELRQLAATQIGVRVRVSPVLHQAARHGEVSGRRQQLKFLQGFCGGTWVAVGNHAEQHGLGPLYTFPRGSRPTHGLSVGGRVDPQWVWIEPSSPRSI